MPRPKTYDREQVLTAAMRRFWHAGYHATSIQDLVAATGVSRHGLYEEFSGKHQLFRQALAHYDATVVTPAVAPMEAPGAGLETIARYLETQIALAASTGLPGPGCLVANTLTELAPHDPDAAAAVAAHHRRLTGAFTAVMAHASSQLGPPRSRQQLRPFAEFLTTAVQGLWSASRQARSPAPLRRQAGLLIDLIEEHLKTCPHPCPPLTPPPLVPRSSAARA